MLAAGLALLLRQLRYDHDPLVFTVFFIIGDLSFAWSATRFSRIPRDG